MNQIIELLKILGLSNAVRLKQRHEEAQPILRGYVTTACIWSLLNSGVMEDLIRGVAIDPERDAIERGLDREVLEAIFYYLGCLDILEKTPNGYVLGQKGKHLMAEPRGSFHLLYGYEPIFSQLEAVLRGEKEYGRDVRRRDEFVARGSGELCQQLPYQVMYRLIEEAGFRKVLDIGCGNAQFLIHLVQTSNGRIQGFGIDSSKEAIEEAQMHLKRCRMDQAVHVHAADMFSFHKWPAGWPDIEVMTAIDVFHEYLYDGIQKIQGLLKQFKSDFPKTALLVGEFCEQTEEQLKRTRSSFLEHHLFHALSRQRILPAAEWRSLFQAAGYTIAKEQIFDLVGHGYFLLR